MLSPTIVRKTDAADIREADAADIREADGGGEPTVRRNSARARARWGLAALGLVVLAIIVTVGAFRAHSDNGFNRWVGWATIWALVVAAAGVVLALWDKIFPAADGPDENVDAVAGALAKIVLAEAQDLRARLIGPGEAGDEAANVRFTKS